MNSATQAQALACLLHKPFTHSYVNMIYWIPFIPATFTLTLQTKKYVLPLNPFATFHIFLQVHTPVYISEHIFNPFSPDSPIELYANSIESATVSRLNGRLAQILCMQTYLHTYVIVAFWLVAVTKIHIKYHFGIRVVHISNSYSITSATVPVNEFYILSKNEREFWEQRFKCLEFKNYVGSK